MQAQSITQTNQRSLTLSKPLQLVGAVFCTVRDL